MNWTRNIDYIRAAGSMYREEFLLLYARFLGASGEGQDEGK
jgi:hypothetical protein